MYDLKELTAFTTVMRTGSLTASAQALSLPKSTLSRHIRQLEAKVGQPLLRREANRMLPTEAGQLFHAYCEQILSLAAEGQEALEALRTDVSGELVLHFHEAFTRGWFTQQVEDFMAHHPGVRVALRTLLEFPRAVPENLLCLWAGPVPDCGMRQEVLGALTRGVYAHPDYLARHGEPSHPRELMRHRWVDLLGDNDGGLTLHHVRAGSFHVSLPPSRMRVDQLVLQGDAITRCHGLGLLPHWLAELRERHHPGTLAPCLRDWQAPALTVSLLYPHGVLPRRARAFIEHLRQAVPEAWHPDRPSLVASGTS